jgi:hypothetical protein
MVICNRCRKDPVATETVEAMTQSRDGSMARSLQICCCTLPVPHRHPNGEHWCDRCGGYLGKPGNFDGPASSHQLQGCGCQPCCAPVRGALKTVASNQLPVKTERGN